MFGRPGGTAPKVKTWLRHLKNFDPHKKKGELIAKNLLEDANVPIERGDKFIQAINRPARTPEQAQELYEDALKELDMAGFAFDSQYNEPNRLKQAPFKEAAKVVDLNNFLEYNYEDGEVILSKELDKSDYVAQKAHEINSGNITVSDLVGKLGGKAYIFITSANSIKEQGTRLKQADVIRNSLGLDNKDLYGSGNYLVCLFYGIGKNTGKLYRPTVLDAGVENHAFLPSRAGKKATFGKTQHLETGKPTHPEIIHRNFAAEQVQEMKCTGPLLTDPPDGYKAIRL